MIRRGLPTVLVLVALSGHPPGAGAQGRSIQARDGDVMLVPADAAVTIARATAGHVKVLRSISLLDQAALDAVRQWRFEPVLVNGVRGRSSSPCP